jgi:hypothetical protein
MLSPIASRKLYSLEHALAATMKISATCVQRNAQCPNEHQKMCAEIGAPVGVIDGQLRQEAQIRGNAVAAKGTSISTASKLKVSPARLPSEGTQRTPTGKRVTY